MKWKRFRLQKRTSSFVNKAGGIVGHGSWYTVDHGHNTGKIISKEYGVNGGIAGSAYDVANILNCLNEGEIIGEDKSGGTATGTAGGR